MASELPNPHAVFGAPGATPPQAARDDLPTPAVDDATGRLWRGGRHRREWLVERRKDGEDRARVCELLVTSPRYMPHDDARAFALALLAATQE